MEERIWSGASQRGARELGRVGEQGAEENKTEQLSIEGLLTKEAEERSHGDSFEKKRKTPRAQGCTFYQALPPLPLCTVDSETRPQTEGRSGCRHNKKINYKKNEPRENSHFHSPSTSEIPCVTLFAPSAPSLLPPLPSLKNLSLFHFLAALQIRHLS